MTDTTATQPTIAPAASLADVMTVMQQLFPTGSNAASATSGPPPAPARMNGIPQWVWFAGGGVLLYLLISR